MNVVRTGLAFFLAAAAIAPPALADAVRYRQPPAAIEAILKAPPLPVTSLSPTKDAIAILVPLRYPPVADLAKPMLRLAGIRIDPQNDGIHHQSAYTSLAFQSVADGRVRMVALPPSAHLTSVRWSPDGKHVAFSNTTAASIDLYVVAIGSAAAHKIAGVHLNGVFGPPIAWMPDSKHLLIKEVPPKHGPEPREALTPLGPIVQETSGKAGVIVTYEDLLANPHDEDLFEYYGTSQLASVDIASGAVTAVGKAAEITRVSISPSGQYVLTETLHRPFSYLFPYERFPTRIAVIDRSGRTVKTIVDGPLEDHLPADGVPTTPREVTWVNSAPATLTWFEALDGGNPKTVAAHRDRIVALEAPFTGMSHELDSTVNRARDIVWLQNDPRAIVRSYDRSTRLTTTTLIDSRTPGSEVQLGSLRDGDRYGDPGTTLTTSAANGEAVVERDGNTLFLAGAGFGPEGRRPFVDRLDLTSMKKERIFISGLDPLEVPYAILDVHGAKMLTQRQSPTMVPNLYVRSGAAEPTQITHFVDPTPQMRAVARKVVTYKRPDGIDLSFTLYLPPNYQPGQKLPTFVWAYPAEFNDRSVASQNTNNTQTFTTVGGNASEVLLALAGYAVLDDAAIPIVGDPATVNDSYVEQLIAGAKAAVDKAVEMGVTDPNRVAVGGHSYGAFMTANLLAHTRIFKAGIARSGAYNRTLTPFGFQSERRSYWEATDLYTKMSPFTYANAIKDPMLMIHGMKDDNTGTFPIQSERMYAAIQGNGGTARLVMLPDEAHGYLGRESVETTVAEMVDWLDKYIGPGAKQAATSK